MNWVSLGSTKIISLPKIEFVYYQLPQFCWLVCVCVYVFAPKLDHVASFNW